METPKNDDENPKPASVAETFNDEVPSTSPGSAVPQQETVPPAVLWQRENRKYTDKVWAVIFLLAYIAFISLGLVFVVKSNPRFENAAETETKIISSHFQQDVRDCCQGIEDRGETLSTFYNLCNRIDASETRRLKAGDSKFDGDEGIFDAFLEAPEIIVGLLSLTVVLAIGWVVLLRYFAKPVVILTELVKVAVFIYMGIVNESTGTKVICFLVAVGILIYDFWARKELLFAAKIISHSATAFKENPAMFVGLIFIKLFYVANAFLFVLFFSEGFNVVEVKTETVCFSVGDCASSCVFDYPAYVSRITTYLCLAYLWTVILFAKMRLSVVANIVGSWHFHPEDKPSITRAIANTMTTSIGTLAVSSLISTVAERLNRILQEPCWKSWLGPAACVTAPLQILLCLFGACIETLVKMLTKFAVILHVFTGLPFIGSAKKVFKIMSRHFKGGFITEATSKGILFFGSYVFSIGIALLSWAWFDKVFDCDTLPGGADATYVIAWVLLGLFNLWYPVLGVYIIILINRALQAWETRPVDKSDEERENYQHLWVSPLAALFVGCIAMMFFTYLAGIILDTVDVLFLCFAIDKDNETESESDGEFKLLVEEIPGAMIDNEANPPVNRTSIPSGDTPAQEATPVAYAVRVA